MGEGKLGYLVAALVLFAIEVLIALFVHDNFIRSHVGDVLAVGLVYATLRAATRVNVLQALALTLAIGRQNGGAQRLDAFALNTLPHTAMKRVCYEVKTSRGDFLSELKRPLKRRIGMRYSNEFYFVTPAALVNAAEDSRRVRTRGGGPRDVRGMEAVDQPSRWLLQL